MKSAKTALGRTINMAALAAKNETTRAVSKHQRRNRYYVN